mmetsp:Transcript_116611/g.302250  ORF Transcript_116611/g.302250 Transcript_116611/m.302250 type:complete len:232 (-) Transcript_116611:65-760(-)
MASTRAHKSWSTSENTPLSSLFLRSFIVASTFFNSPLRSTSAWLCKAEIFGTNSAMESSTLSSSLRAAREDSVVVVCMLCEPLVSTVATRKPPTGPRSRRARRRAPPRRAARLATKPPRLAAKAALPYCSQPEAASGPSACEMTGPDDAEEASPRKTGAARGAACGMATVFAPAAPAAAAVAGLREGVKKPPAPGATKAGCVDAVIGVAAAAAIGKPKLDILGLLLSGMRR